MQPVLRFHANCGENIVLTNQQQTAQRKGSSWRGGIVVACDGMLPDRLYEVHLDQRDADSGWYIWVGVTTAAPDTLALPRYACRWKSAVVVAWDSVHECGSVRKTNVGQKLLNLPQGSRVGVRVDRQASLHLYIDGQDQGMAAHNVAQPCFAFFQLWGSCTKVTALPVTTVQ